MKSILFFTDTHLAADPIGQLLGDYGRDMLEKIAWVAEKGREYDLVCFGGDLVNAPGVSLRVVNTALELLSQAHLNLALVFGQHDLVGHSTGTISHSAASVAYWALQNHPGTKPQVTTELAGLKLQLISHHPGIETEIRAGQGEQTVDVAVVHALVGYEVPIEEVRLKAVIVLTGDFHQGYEPQQANGSWFFNPGALSRKTIDDYERIPKVASLRYDERLRRLEDWEYLPVPCKPADRVFDLSKHLERKAGEAAHSEYIKLLGQATVAPQMPVEEMLEAMGVEEPVRGYVESKIKEAEQKEK